MTNLQAVFFDIDGTLISFETHTIPQSTIKAIKQLKEKGVKVIIATGRAMCDINNLGEIEFDGFITSNGAYCVTTEGEVIFKNLIPKSNLNALSKYLEEDPISCVFVTEKANFVNFVSDDMKKIHSMVNLKSPDIKPLNEILEYDIVQLDLFVDAEKEKKILNNILTDCGGARWHPSFTDVNVKNNNKGTGVDKFAEHFGFAIENTMAFGDGGNDIEMLKHAGIGIAMGNANEDVKLIADYVTTSVDNDGILNALKHFNVLKE